MALASANTMQAVLELRQRLMAESGYSKTQNPSVSWVHTGSSRKETVVGPFDISVFPSESSGNEVYEWVSGDTADAQSVYKQEEKARHAEAMEAKRLFFKLRRRWLERTRFVSDPATILGDPALLQILSLGDKVIPWMISDMVNSGTAWYAVLPGLLGHEPVGAAVASNPEELIAVWQNWARQNRIL